MSFHDVSFDFSLTKCGNVLTDQKLLVNMLTDVGKV